MKRKSKDLLKRIGLWAVVITTLISSVGLSSVFAVNQAQVAARNARELIEQAAQAQVVAYTFAKCMNYRVGEGDYNRKISSNDIKKGNWFSSNVAVERVATGAWLESQVQGDFTDGKITCNNKNNGKNGITQALISTLSSVSSELDIVCNKYSDNGNGHLSGGIFKHNNDTACEDYESGVYYKVDEETSKAYIGKLYTEAMQDNPYAKSWNKIDTYDSATGYLLYKQDFDTACADEYLDDNSNVTTFSKKVKVVQDDGSIVEKYVKPKKNKNDNTSSGRSFAASGPTTCGGLIDKMNQYAEDYQKALLDTIRQECGSQEAQEALAAKIAEYEEKAANSENGLSDDEQKELDKLKEIQSSGDYTQSTSTGGLECVETDSFSVVMDDPSDGSESSEITEEEACFQNAGSLGWIICPIIFGLRSAVTETYEAIEPFIMVDENIIDEITNGLNNSSGNIYPSWNTFRVLANILFVIFFLFVIFSQLTGFGIDNYGIKKMLPKLIVSAILVNLSFVICAVAVDLSNLLGQSINNMLISLAPEVTSLEASSGGHMGAYFASVVAAVVGVIAAGVLAGWTIIIPILLFLLTLIISIIFALIVLGLRQAIVIALIVVSPLAIVFYTLPNTQKVFEQWFKIFKNILMVYPVCGALIGGGYFASHILMNAYGAADSDTVMGHFMTILAGLLCVVPYFFIPSLTRKAVDGLGGIASGITNFGNQLGRNTSSRINNSSAVQNARKNAQAEAANRRANLSRPMDALTMKASKAAAGATTRRGKALGWVANHTIASNGRLRAVQEHAETRVANSNETARMNAEGARNTLDRMVNGGYEAREAGLEKKALEDAITDQTSLYEKSGVFSNLGDGDFKDGTFETEVYNAAINKDDAKLEALMRQATNGTDKQREKLRQGMDKALSEGKVSQDTAQRYASHVQSNGIYKTKDRSMNDQADAIMRTVNTLDANGISAYTNESGKSLTTAAFAGNGIFNGKQSGTMAFDFDDAEFDALAAKARDASTSAAEKQQIATIMSEALNMKDNDSTGQYNNIKPETIGKINEVLSATGMNRDYSAGVLKVSHDEPALNYFDRAEIMRRVSAGDFTSEQGAKLIGYSADPNSTQSKYIQSVTDRVKNNNLSRDEADRIIKNMLDKSDSI